MQLKLFNGGLSTRLAEELIQPNEAIVCSNVDTTTGQLKSVKGTTDTGIVVDEYLTYFEAEDRWVSSTEPRDYVQHNDELLWTGKGRAKKLSNGVERFLGIEQPLSRPSTSAFMLSAPTPPSTSSVPPTLAPRQHSSAFSAFPNSSGSSAIDFPPYTAFEVAVVVYQNGVPIATVEFTTSSTQSNIRELTYRTGDNVLVGSTLKCYRKFAGEWRLDTEGSVKRAYGGFSNVFAVATVYDLSDRPVATLPDSRGLPLNTVKTFGLTETINGVQSPMAVFDAVVTSADLSDPSRYPAIRMETGILHPTWWVQAGGLWVRLGSSQLYEYAVTPDITTDNIYEPSGVSGEVQYVYTYYSEADGTESQPSDVSEVVTVDHGAVSLLLTASADPQVTHIKVYRVGGTLTKFTEVLEVSNISGTYTDSAPDAKVTNRTLSSVLNGAPVEGLRYLTQAYNVFFGAHGNKLYFTRDIGNPNYWPETHYIDFNEHITGIGLAANGVVIMTRYKSYVLTGTGATTFVKRQLSADQGCIEHSSIVAKGGTLLFVSTDGICATAGSSVKVLSKDKLGKLNLSVVNACVHDEVYYVQLQDYTILALDLRYEQAIINYSLESQRLVVAEDTLYGVLRGKLHTLFTGDLVEYAYTTGAYSEGAASELKAYSTVRVAADGEHVISIAIDGYQVVEASISGKRIHDIAIPQKFARGATIQFRLTGRGIIKEIEYEVARSSNA